MHRIGQKVPMHIHTHTHKHTQIKANYETIELISTKENKKYVADVSPSANTLTF